MRARHPVPTIWLMTDERIGAALWCAVARLPREAGIVFRHHATPLAERRRLFAALLSVAQRRRLILVRAGPVRMRGEMGVHLDAGGCRVPSASRGRLGVRTAPAHDRREAIAGIRAGATILFVSPVFATATHPGAPGLGPLRAATIAHGLGATKIALGGMTASRYRQIKRLGFEGWAAIDAWL